ncbi:NUDIX hydrolase [Dethiothermospora halolimnae]|uniref:NUDIX hydrolase n=1 Tax=Dethiothermospora halolimnae TaxID=3114390 RepID=UPI003CCBAF48
MIHVLAKGLIRKEDSILLIKRDLNSSFGGGLWDIPGGKLEFGEETKDALLREVYEETALDINVLRVLDVCSGISDKKGKQYITIIYLTDYMKGKINLNEEHDEYIWVKLDELDRYKSDMVYYAKHGIEYYKEQNKI